MPSRVSVPGAIVEVVGEVAPYLFTCEERHMNPASMATAGIRNARHRMTLTHHAV